MSKSVFASQVASIVDHVSPPRHRDQTPTPAGLTTEQEDEIVEIFKVPEYDHFVPSLSLSLTGSRTYSGPRLARLVVGFTEEY